MQQMLRRQGLPKAKHTSASRPAQSRRRFVTVCIFEKFTERSIRAVLISQSEAKKLGGATCSTQQVESNA
jgi:hypothetical protein